MFFAISHAPQQSTINSIKIGIFLTNISCAQAIGDTVVVADVGGLRVLRRIWPPTTPIRSGQLSPLQPALLDVCPLLAHCMMTLGQVDMWWSTAVSSP